MDTQSREELLLSALVLRFTVCPARRFDVAGASAQALVLALIERGNPVLASAMRRHEAARPYTVAVLQEECTPSQLLIRVTAIGAAIPAALVTAMGTAGDSASFVLGSTLLNFDWLSASSNTSPWAGSISLGGINKAAEQLGDELTFVLASPLLPRHCPAHWLGGPPAGAVLSPIMLFFALRERWQALGASVPCPSLNDVAWAAASVDVRTSSIAVTAHLRRGGEKHVREVTTGFSGRLTLRLNGSTKQRTLLRGLAAAGFYLGAGVGTAQGMGRLRAHSASCPLALARKRREQLL